MLKLNHVGQVVPQLLYDPRDHVAAEFYTTSCRAGAASALTSDPLQRPSTTTTADSSARTIREAARGDRTQSAEEAIHYVADHAHALELGVLT